MRITGVSVYRTDLPYVGGSYGWGAGNAITTALSTVVVLTTDLHNYNSRSTGQPGPRTARGRLFASDDPGLGVEPDYDCLGEPVARYGAAA